MRGEDRVAANRATSMQVLADNAARAEAQGNVVYRLLKICVLLATFLVAAFSSILLLVELVFGKGDMNNTKHFETLHNPYKRITEETIPTVQHWYQNLDNTEDLLLMNGSRSWPELDQNNYDTPCIDDFFQTLKGTTNHTTPDLIKLALHMMGLSHSAVVHQHLRELLTSEKELSSLYEDSSSCLQSNAAIAKIACEARGGVDSIDSELLEYLINEAAVLDALTLAMYEDLSVVSDVVQILLDSKETVEAYIDVASASIDKHEFLTNKFEGIVHLLRGSIELLATNNIDGAQAMVGALQKNILEAVKLDIVNGFEANARVGVALAANVQFAPVIEDHKQKWPLGEHWVNAYISWNLAFVASLGNILPSKLLIPSVACTAKHNHGEDFIHRRTVSLAASYLYSTMYNKEIDAHDLGIDGGADKIQRIQQELFSLKRQTPNPPLVQMLGHANMENVVLTNPSPGRVEEMLFDLCGTFCHGLDQWQVSQTTPLDELENDDYQIYVSLIVWATIMFSGIGLEIWFWWNFLRSGWNEKLQSMWRFAQLAFPLLALITFGLALHQNFLALLFLVMSLFKFGFSEVILHMYSAIYSNGKGAFSRVGDFLDSAGLMLHHGSASLVISILLTGVLPPNRHAIDPILVLIIQHWFVLLEPLNQQAYIAVECLLEVCFEWIVVSQFEVYAYKLHWTVPIAAAGMLISHWMYIGAGLLRFSSGSDILEKQNMVMPEVSDPFVAKVPNQKEPNQKTFHDQVAGDVNESTQEISFLSEDLCEPFCFDDNPGGSDAVSVATIDV
ncbi:expressed unknown protein [Seminavis robusta]|uniref:Uncharacterized protein n=1 Tax=Seminavis robusta TaxID=568900 RepID=A0A9N8DMU1_9STRA|nr:expressed unknown protein [Seminavis robusta]|eukprot:Sro167_g074380.1 n/a (789) ;mRNA; f:23535-25901